MKQQSRPYLILCLLMVMYTTASAQEQYSRVKIYPPTNKQERGQLLALLEIDHFSSQGGAIISEISHAKVSLLSRTNYRYEILVDDVAVQVKELNRQYFSASAQGRVAMEQPAGVLNDLIPTPASFQVHTTFGGYYSFAQMNAAMDELVAAYPSLASKTSLGFSTEGRNIWCIKISDSVATDESGEPEALYIGLQHAREAITGSSMIFFMQYLCENYATDKRIKDLVNNREIFIIPCMNPDAWEFNRIGAPNGFGFWRKNRRNNGDGTFGVDLNRNWGVDWGNCTGALGGDACGTNLPLYDSYWGTGPFSESETRAVRDFVLSHHIVSCIDQHSFGGYHSIPLGRPSLHRGVDSLTQMDQDYYKSVSAVMGKYSGMRAGNSSETLGYEIAGGLKDWLLKGDIGTGTKGKVRGVTSEANAGGEESFYGFWPPASQIINLCKELVYQDLQMAFAAGTYVDITDQSDIAINSLSGPFNFKIKRIGIGDGPVTVTLLPLENIQSAGAAITVNSIPVYGGNYSGYISYSLPAAIQPGERIKYAWKVQADGQTWYDTIIKLYRPVELFYDDMEGSNIAAKWTVSGNWAYANTLSFAGEQSLSESPSGFYGQNWNTTIRCNTVFDLSDATEAYLTFRVRHRAENFRDKLQVQVSADGNNWTAIAGRTTVQQPGTADGSTINGIPSLTGIREDWTPEVFDLSAWQGQSALQFRFVFSSDSSNYYHYNVDEGFNIDNLKLVKNRSECNEVTGLSSSAITNTSATISWNVSPDALSYEAAYKVSSSDTWISTGAISTDTSVSLSDLEPGTAYDWGVRAHCSKGPGLYAQGQFVTLCGAPSGLNAVINTSTSVTLNWSSPTGSVSFDVDYKPAASGSWSSAATDITGTSFTLNNLNASVYYDWRIRSNCYSGGSSNYGQGQFFTGTGCSALYELNNTRATAALIQNGIPLYAAIAVTGDVDYYRINASGLHDLVFSLAGPAGVNYSMEVFNNSGILVGSTGNGGSISLHNRSGNHYVKIAGINGISSSICYKLTATMIPVVCPGPYDLSTNGTAAGAALIPLNTTIKGRISGWGDVDYYKFVQTTDGPLTISLRGVAADYDMVLLSSDGTTQLALSQNGGVEDEIISGNYPAGTYYIGLYGYNNANNLLCYTLKAEQGIALKGQELFTSNKVGKKAEDWTDVRPDNKPGAFPNPVKNTVTLYIPEIKGTATVRVFDMYGKMALQTTTTKTNTPIDISRLSSGMYIIRVMNDGREEVVKIVKE